ncbi:protein SPT2 homolog [Amphibalanus amphitrite]|uniref:protein SPT2 homolog n=1 Tax=Amphibalanus amphitrite TaxID=1232801 RepID=UPI001C92A794|nr:protein SPT2 homolog [Amphibalanus amphitrite]
MDFGYLLEIAKQNEDASRDLAKQKRFSTELSKPKKLEKSKVKSGNIQRFLAQREAEEKKKQEEERKKKETLLHLRSEQKGAKRRVSAMLNRTKGANRSVLEDAKDKYNTAATIDGAYQPDEDDYGYESKTATDMYSKLLQQYEKMPDKEYLKQKKKTKANAERSLDLAATKARVKQSLDNQEEEERNMKGHRRRRKHGESSTATETAARTASPTAGRAADDSGGGGKKKKAPPVRRGGAPPPPGLDFHSILALAAEKQHQPIVVPEKPAADPEQRPLTAREKADLEASRQRELRKQGKLPPAKHKDYNDLLPPEKPRRGSKIPKKEVKSEAVVREEPEPEPRPGPSGARPAEKPRHKDSPSRPPAADVQRKPAPEVRRRAASPPDPRRPGLAPPSTSKRKSSPPPPPSAKKHAPEAKKKPAMDVKPKQFPPADLKPKQFPPADMKRKQFPPADVKRKQFPPADLQPKQFPPADMKKRRFNPANLSRQPARHNRIESDDSEYDSEMDDFIDDGPQGDENDYSSAIKQIFGYDKSKYRDIDEDDSDMEADFSTLMSEEARSARLAAEEDEQEFRKEMEHKKRKMAMKKRAMMGR